jgi:hypothetical protein
MYLVRSHAKTLSLYFLLFYDMFFAAAYSLVYKQTEQTI